MKSPNISHFKMNNNHSSFWCCWVGYRKISGP